MKDVTINIKNVSKTYRLYDKPMDRVKEALKRGSCYHKDFYAVSDISFQVHKGETVGIIGKNGAGKSTLLKMITGVLTPTEGTIELSGSVSALLELGAGFDAERNGIENIYLNGRINGLSKEEIEGSIDDILEFADIGEFVYQPIKTYSSGMLVRLAFATAVNIKPEILIVDEALSVGDVRFQQKCYRKIREFKKNGTVLFVSHDTGAITSFCDRVIWIDDGKIYKEGRPDEIIKEYLSFMRYDVKKEETQEKEETPPCEEVIKVSQEEPECPVHNPLLEFGNMDAKFSKIILTNQYGQAITQVVGGQTINFYMEIQTKKTIESPILGFNIKDPLGNEIIVTNTFFEDVKLPKMKKGKIYSFAWEFTFPDFHSGSYPVDIALVNGTYHNHESVDFINDALILKCEDAHLYQEGRGRYILNNVILKELGEKNV